MTQGFFFCKREVCSPVLFLYSCLPHIKCWQRVNTRTYTTTAKVHVSSDKALCCIYFLFSCSQAFRRLLRGDFSLPEGWVHSAVSILFGEDSTQVSHVFVFVSGVFVFFNGSSCRLKVNDRLRIIRTKWADTHTLTHEAHGVGVQCWKWRGENRISCEIEWADRLCLTKPIRCKGLSIRLYLFDSKWSIKLCLKWRIGRFGSRYLYWNEKLSPFCLFMCCQQVCPLISGQITKETVWLV